ncbi:helix-turn-helix domain-containing protein [Patescibacteria group bacterium]|nr:helix-turn-helix domain-containing protein [Patescibacteria group bacterium]MBU4309684.1 helix-turn-helix domain-containing protein [Patescibacteria group bacterium]MBU4431692.1 helix-turn-helix domain-containing protein [Patescibacteria group bacterium]MBU4577928.1 helix-turn-helix domain-containing protein [Patescibacteria group bacterium]
MTTDLNNVLKLITTDQLAGMLSISKVTVYRLVESRQIPFYKIKGSIRFNKDDVLKYLQDNRIESGF